MRGSSSCSTFWDDSFAALSPDGSMDLTAGGLIEKLSYNVNTSIFLGSGIRNRFGGGMVEGIMVEWGSSDPVRNDMSGEGLQESFTRTVKGHVRVRLHELHRVFLNYAQRCFHAPILYLSLIHI